MDPGGVRNPCWAPNLLGKDKETFSLQEFPQIWLSEEQRGKGGKRHICHPFLPHELQGFFSPRGDGGGQVPWCKRPWESPHQNQSQQTVLGTISRVSEPRESLGITLGILDKGFWCSGCPPRLWQRVESTQSFPCVVKMKGGAPKGRFSS